jgi:uncharacterized protein
MQYSKQGTASALVNTWVPGFAHRHMPKQSHILFFIKAPVRGTVKTRLAEALGDDVALELYKNFILDGLETVKQSGYPFSICIYPPEAGKEVAFWLGGSYRYLPQRGDDLGERMENAFIHCFREGCERAILIGSDLPDLTAAVLREAISSLAQCDAVLGPASDGGYYLIGFNKHSFSPRIFHGISWGGKTVFQDTLEMLRSSAHAVYLTPRWNDVDTMDDLKALCGRSKHIVIGKSRTLVYLENIGPF